jgi:hypothetical protein
MRLERKLGFYEKYIKRLLDIICSFLFIIVFLLAIRDYRGDCESEDGKPGAVYTTSPWHCEERERDHL